MSVLYICCGLATKSLHDPLLLAQGTPVVLLDPELHAAVVEGVIALTPHHYVEEGEISMMRYYYNTRSP